MTRIDSKTELSYNDLYDGQTIRDNLQLQLKTL